MSAFGQKRTYLSPRTDMRDYLTCLTWRQHHPTTDYITEKRAFYPRKRTCAAHSFFAISSQQSYRVSRDFGQLAVSLAVSFIWM